MRNRSYVGEQVEGCYLSQVTLIYYLHVARWIFHRNRYPSRMVKNRRYGYRRPAAAYRRIRSMISHQYGCALDCSTLQKLKINNSARLYLKDWSNMYKMIKNQVVNFEMLVCANCFCLYLASFCLYLKEWKNILYDWESVFWSASNFEVLYILSDHLRYTKEIKKGTNGYKQFSVKPF